MQVAVAALLFYLNSDKRQGLCFALVVALLIITLLKDIQVSNFDCYLSLNDRRWLCMSFYLFCFYFCFLFCLSSTKNECEFRTFAGLCKRLSVATLSLDSGLGFARFFLKSFNCGFRARKLTNLFVIRVKSNWNDIAVAAKMLSFNNSFSVRQNLFGRFCTLEHPFIPLFASISCLFS